MQSMLLYNILILLLIKWQTLIFWQMFPLKFLRDNEVMPIMMDGKIYILTANPFDFQPLDELNMLLGGNAHYAVAPLSVIINGINRYYPLEGTERMMKELEEEEDAPKEVAFEEIEEKDILGHGNRSANY